MTNAIETTKRALFDCLERIKRAAKHRVLTAEFEERLEEHLEELRKDSAANQARIGELYSSRQQWCGIAADRLANLSSMIEERDQLQDRLHAVDRAYVVLDQANKVAGEELRKAQEQSRVDRQDLISAEQCSDDFSDKLTHATTVIGQQEQLIVGQRLAIADLYMGIKKQPRRTLSQIKEAMQPKKACGFCGGLGYIHCNGGRPTAPCPKGCQ